jgi:cyanophycinase-like exopeptidase
MSDIKPLYLLAGGRGGSYKSTRQILQAVFREIGKASPNIAYVGAASDDNRIFYQFIAGMIKDVAACKVNRVVTCSRKADINKAKGALESADAIFISGGDVEMGMRVLEEKNLAGTLQALYKQGKLFFGASAGSIMLAGEWVRWKDPDDDSTAELFPCLGLARLICDTHAEDDDWAELKMALKLSEDDAQGYGIPAEACLKVYPDGKVEALGGAVTRYIRHSGQAEQQADLLPTDRAK